MDNENEIAWFAGLYEGEGCLSQDNRNGLWRLHISMTDEDVIRHAGNFMGCKVAGPYQIGKNKPYWRVTAYDQRLVAHICDLMYPYLGTRRKAKIDEARLWLQNSKYGFCRKGIHPMDDVRTTSGSSTRCKLCKTEYQRQYRKVKKEDEQSSH